MQYQTGDTQCRGIHKSVGWCAKALSVPCLISNSFNCTFILYRIMFSVAGKTGAQLQIFLTSDCGERFWLSLLWKVHVSLIGESPEVNINPEAGRNLVRNSVHLKGDIAIVETKSLLKKIIRKLVANQRERCNWGTQETGKNNNVRTHSGNVERKHVTKSIRFK